MPCLTEAHFKVCHVSLLYVIPYCAPASAAAARGSRSYSQNTSVTVSALCERNAVRWYLFDVSRHAQIVIAPYVTQMSDMLYSCNQPYEREQTGNFSAAHQPTTAPGEAASLTSMAMRLNRLGHRGTCALSRCKPTAMTGRPCMMNSLLGMRIATSTTQPG